MSISEEDKHAIKFLTMNKNAKRFKMEFPNKNWKKQDLLHVKQAVVENER